MENNKNKENEVILENLISQMKIVKLNEFD